MNEELRIIIRAVTDEARRRMQEVRQELRRIDEAGEEAGKSIKQSMQNVAKGAAVAVTAITAVTTGMAALGKQSQEAQKHIGKLITAFQSVGSTASQATKTYTALYRFLGQSDTATEAANLLAQITTNTKDLTEWTKILQGVYAKFPDSLPIEGLVESANETIRVGKVTGNLADALNWAGVSEDAFNAKLATTTSFQEREALLRETLNGLYMNASNLYERNNKVLLQNAEAQAKLDSALAQAHRYLVPLLTALSNLGTTLLTYLKPALETVSAVLIVFIEYIIAAIRWVGSFFSIFTDVDVASGSIADSVTSVGDSIQSATGSVGGLGDALNGATSAAKELKKQTMGFDELNVMQPKASSSATGGGSYVTPSISGVGAIAMPNISEIADSVGLTEFSKTVDEIREKINGVLTLVGLVAAGFGAWKLAGVIELLDDFNAGLLLDDDIKKLDLMKASMKKFAGLAVTAAGAMLILKGYTDAWADGVDWGNLALLIGGVALAITGLQIAFGGLSAVFTVFNTTIKVTVANLALLVAGIGLIILGVKDFIDNGPTLQNTILIIGGAIAIAVGLATAGLSVLLSAIIAAVAAIGAFVAAILLEEPAIMTVEEAQNNLTEAINRTIEAENSYINALDSAEAAQQKLKEAEEAAGITGEELRKQVENGTLTYADMTDAQKECYKAYLDNEQKQKDLKASTEEFEKAKKAETIASFENQLALAKESDNYDDYKKSVIDAFNNGKLSAEEARMLIEKSMSEMSDDAQKTFMEDLPDSIKDGMNPSRYETTRKKISDWFKQAWKDIKGFFSDAGEFFGKVGKKVGDAITNAVKSAINWILEKAVKLINGFIGGINWAIGVINKIPGVNISKLTLLDVPKLAKGGITTGSTLANIGEAGREAVLPLENHTEWMDDLADKIARRNSTPTKIVLQVGEQELGWATINSINGITKQTGGLKLQIV